MSYHLLLTFCIVFGWSNALGSTVAFFSFWSFHFCLSLCCYLAYVLDRRPCRHRCRRRLMLFSIVRFSRWNLVSHSEIICYPKSVQFLIWLTWISLLKWAQYEIGQGICFEFVLSSRIFSSRLLLYVVLWLCQATSYMALDVIFVRCCCRAAASISTLCTASSAFVLMKFNWEKIWTFENGNNFHFLHLIFSLVFRLNSVLLAFFPDLFGTIWRVRLLIVVFCWHYFFCAHNKRSDRKMNFSFTFSGRSSLCCFFNRHNFCFFGCFHVTDHGFRQSNSTTKVTTQTSRTNHEREKTRYSSVKAGTAVRRGQSGCFFYSLDSILRMQLLSLRIARVQKFCPLII